jgi:hypothetical protein
MFSKMGSYATKIKEDTELKESDKVTSLLPLI